MTSVKPQGPLAVGTVRGRKPTRTYQSPPQSTAILHPGKLASHSATASSVPHSPPTELCHLSESELSQGNTVARSSSRHHMTTPLLPLYHPFGTLALSLPDLDPSAFGLPAPVAVFDDPTRRSHRQRRPAAKIREVEEAAAFHPPSFITATPTPESEVREKSSPRRRRGGPGGKRRRREPEDGDATYPAKRPRNPRSSGVASGLSGTRALSREEGSPALSNAHSGASPALDPGRGDPGEEKKAERRTTRSRGIVMRRDSTASEETTTSTTPSVSATNAAVPPRLASSGELLEADALGAIDTLKEATDVGVELKKADPDDTPVLEQQGETSRIK